MSYLQFIVAASSGASGMWHFDESATSTTFLDSSGNGIHLTGYGTAQTNASQSVFGSMSMRVQTGTAVSSNAGGAYADQPASLIVGTQPFTIEGRVRIEYTMTAGDSVRLFELGAPGEGEAFVVDVNPLNMRLRAGVDNGGGTLGTNVAFSASTWHAWAVTRDGDGLVRGFIDGALLNDARTIADDFSPSTDYKFISVIASSSDTGTQTTYFDEMRITVGACLYTADYTVATAPF